MTATRTRRGPMNAPRPSPACTELGTCGRTGGTPAAPRAPSAPPQGPRPSSLTPVRPHAAARDVAAGEPHGHSQCSRLPLSGASQGPLPSRAPHSVTLPGHCPEKDPRPSTATFPGVTAGRGKGRKAARDGASRVVGSLVPLSGEGGKAPFL